MFIISLYHIDLLPLPHKFQRNTYGQSQINHIKGFRTLGVGNGFPTGGQPLLSHALSCRTAQIVRAFKQSDRFADRDVVCIRQFLGETFHTGRHQRPADPPRSWTQTYHGLHGRGSCPQSSRSLAEGHGQEASDLTFKRFLSALAAVGDTLGIKFRHNAA